MCKRASHRSCNHLKGWLGRYLFFPLTSLQSFSSFARVSWLCSQHVYFFFPEIGDVGSLLNPSGGSALRKLQTRGKPFAIHASARRIGRSRRGEAIPPVRRLNGVLSEIRFLCRALVHDPPHGSPLRRATLYSSLFLRVPPRTAALCPRIDRSRRGAAIPLVERLNGVGSEIRLL